MTMLQFIRQIPFLLRFIRKGRKAPAYLTELIDDASSTLRIVQSTIYAINYGYDEWPLR